MFSTKTVVFIKIQMRCRHSKCC